MKLSRRQVAQSLVAGTAATAVLGGQAPPQPPAADAAVADAQAALRANVQLVYSVDLPRTIEPAFTFEARG